MLPVGGIKEKVLAAHRLGVTEVLLPARNEKAVKEDISENVRSAVRLHLVNTIDEVLALALSPASTHEAAQRPEHWPAQMHN